MFFFCRFILGLALVSLAHCEVDLITKPEPGQEYVFVQTSSSGARPISRKDKVTVEERPFETAHKLPLSLTYLYKKEKDEEKNMKPSKPQKREASPADAPAPAPAGAIKLDPLKLIERYKTELKSSTTPKPAPTQKTKRSRTRTKKEAIEVTSPSPVLTTGVAIKKVADDDVPLGTLVILLFLYDTFLSLVNNFIIME